MNKYTIYCTPEQARKAFKLNVPLECTGYFIYFKQDGIVLINNTNYRIPNTEQILCLLEEQGVTFEIIMANKHIAYFTL